MLCVTGSHLARVSKLLTVRGVVWDSFDTHSRWLPVLDGLTEK